MSSQMDLTKARADTTTNTSSEGRSAKKNIQITRWRHIYMILALCLIYTLNSAMNKMNAWPYLENLDNSTRQEFFGLCKTFSMASMVLGSFLAGWMANRMMDTRPPILFGIILGIVTGIFYANIEVFDVGLRRWAYLFAEICFDFSGGAILSWRAFIPSASAPEDCQKAFALTHVAGTSSFIISPFIVLPLGKLFSESVLLPWGAQLNIFTAPVYISVLLSLLLALLFAFHFDGSFQVPTRDEAGKEEEEEPRKLSLVERRRWSRSDSRAELATNEQKTETNNESWTSSDSTSGQESLGLDWLAISCCFLARFTADTYFVFSMTLASSFTMATFGWSGEQSIAFSTVAHGAFGGMALLVSIGFSTKYLSKLAEERLFVLISLALMLLFYLLTFPWPFLTAKMPNCDLARYSWCESVPAINVYIYHIALICCMGLALPIVFLNLDVLYSRLLGAVKQGIFQSIFNIIYGLVMMIGPPLINFAFQNYGPLPIWLTYVGLISVTILLWILNYRRLLPKSV